MKFYLFLLCALSSSSAMAMNEKDDQISSDTIARPVVPPLLLLNKQDSANYITSPRTFSLPYPSAAPHSPLSPRPNSWSCSSLPPLSPHSQNYPLSPSSLQSQCYLSQRYLPRLETVLPEYWRDKSEVLLLSPWEKLEPVKFKNELSTPASSSSSGSSPTYFSDSGDDKADFTIKSEEDFNGVLSSSIQHLKIDFIPTVTLLNQILENLSSLKYLYFNVHLSKKSSDSSKPMLMHVRHRYLTLSKQDAIDLSTETILQLLQGNEEALQVIRIKASDGLQAAQYILGQIYENHQMIPEEIKGENETNALLWYKQAEGNAGAQYNLGRYYLTKANSEAGTPRIKGWREGAFELFRVAAAQGHRKAQFRLAEYYLKEQISEPVLVKKRNEAEAFRFFRLAAEQGHTKAQTYLGWMYAKKNMSQAVLWLQRAADKGHLGAQYNLAMIYKDPRIQYTGQISQEERTQEAFRLLTLAAGRNFMEAYLPLGDLYYENQGLPSGISRSERMNEAWRWFQRAAEGSVVEAKFKVALMRLYEQKVETKEAKKWFFDEIDPLFYIWFIHRHPQGVGEPSRENDQKAIEWLQEVISEHAIPRFGKQFWQLPTMQFALGWMYMNGRVQDEQPQEEHDLIAFDLLDKAASQGLREAQFSLGRMYWEGRIAGGKLPENDLIALDLFNKASENNVVEALFYLGEMYYEGRVEGGRSIDNSMKATKLYKQASDKGLKKAEDKLKIIFRLPI
ncbi:MAG: sel1 repeat family protein [Alphaproteobacteria bacterium]|nr:sel1 repeat family protein [Alphaproteobacteria bacterium]